MWDEAGITIGLSGALVAAVAAAIVLWILYRRGEETKRQLLRRIDQQKSNPDDRVVQDDYQLQALGKVTGGVAHDLNSALSVVVMNLDVLQQDHALDDKHRRRIDNMIKAAQKGTRLLRYLLNLSHRRASQPDVVQLSEVIPSLTELIQSAFSKQIEIEPIVARDLWNTYLDVSEFEIAAIHLAVKISHAIPDATRLIIELKNDVLDGGAPNRTVEHVVFAITGSGTGKVKTADKSGGADFVEPDCSFEAAERVARQAGGYMRIEEDSDHGMRVALYFPRCLETTLV